MIIKKTLFPQHCDLPWGVRVYFQFPVTTPYGALLTSWFFFVAKYYIVATFFSPTFGGTVASCLVHSPSDQAVQARAMAKDIQLCSRVTHFTLIVLL